ncbi:hypothetical protein [Agriterribacter sp.]|nr:hypothetical protein [Agriterribacter sp.]HRP55100.1 hypothetical protein [Agriterribacter sp.]
MRQPHDFGTDSKGSVELATEMIWKFIKTAFDGGRHAKRAGK